MRILFVTSCLSYGGAEKVLSFIASKFADKGNKVAIAHFKTAPTQLEISNHISVYEIEYRNVKYYRRLDQISNLKKVVEVFRPDLIISFVTMPNFVSVITGKLTGVPVIISERGDPSVQSKGFKNIIVRQILSLAKGFVFQTKFAMNHFPKRVQKKSAVIANPVFIKSDLYKSSCREKKISFVARFFNVQKRQDIMVEAFAIVNKIYPEYKLYFYGDGSDIEMIKNMVTSRGLDDKVVFAGKVDDIAMNIADSSMFVLTSDYEGVPNALLEAMAIGLPVIATDCTPGGARLLLRNESYGQLVPRGSSSSVAEAIIKYIENPNYASECGKNAKYVNELYSEEKIIAQWNTYIDNIMGLRDKV